MASGADNRGTITSLIDRWVAVRRNWLTAGAAALLFLTLLGGIVTTFYHARRSERRFDQVRGIARALLLW
jgi:ABC-type spermidine/putrescine transport system permease subunit I